MGIIRLTLFTVLGIGGAMLWFGREEGLPEDRLGYTPRPVGAVATAPIGELTLAPAPTLTSVPTPAPVPAPAPTPAPAPAPETASPATSANVAPVSVPVGAPAPVAAPVVAPMTAPAPAPAPRLYVTGSRVNMRAGTSTREEILAKLVRGTEVEFLGTPTDGWTEIRVVETGARGFMASQFLSPNRP